MHHSHAELRPVRSSIDTMEEIENLHDLRLSVVNAIIREVSNSRANAQEHKVLDVVRFHLDRWLVHEGIADQVTVSVIVRLYEHLRPIALAVAEGIIQTNGGKW